ncbi:3'-5' exonuclease [Desulfuromonas sp. AOP6]|uniref:3'-5' exonuclease n=1 Tax=Desulfuromonas sp. AOP6 TaxID=1566351 RepID=UPI001274DD48|nr:3'-5' exonuclease [Desulfuromonas sp. AOP6]BCA79443.1 DNA polymerase III subunit epsilon [Desulfuromonas sp. AOP6]
MSAKGKDFSVVVLDFETTGMAPDRGDRAIEVGAVRIDSGRIVDRFQSLMHPGMRVSPFIEDYTGITNAMLRDAPSPVEVMRDFHRFLGDCPLIAHNASFDRRFLEAEFRRAGLPLPSEYACSLLVARRIYPEAPNHKLATLVHYRTLPVGNFHRALADAEMTAHLWLRMMEDIRNRCGLRMVPFSLMQELGKVKIKRVSEFLESAAGDADSDHKNAPGLIFTKTLRTGESPC